MRATLRVPLPAGVVLGISILVSSGQVRAAPGDAALRLDSPSLQRVPTDYKLQARISQARIPDGEGDGWNVLVKLADGATELCTQHIPGAEVSNGVLNLDLDDLDCGGVSVDEAIAGRAALAFAICTAADSCLESIPLRATPFATKAAFALEARRAERAEATREVVYAHRLASDADVLTGNSLGVGHFDLQTPDSTYVPGAEDIYTDYAMFAHQGFVSWAPVSTAGASRVNLCSLDAGDYVELDALVAHASVASFSGKLHVTESTELGAALEASSGLTVSSGSLDVASGQASVANAVVMGAGSVVVDSQGMDVPNGEVLSKDLYAPHVVQARERLAVGTASGAGMSVGTGARFTGAVSAAGTGTVALQASGPVAFGEDAALSSTSLDCTASSELRGVSQVTGRMLIGESPVSQSCGTGSALVAQNHAWLEGPAAFDNAGHTVAFQGPVSFRSSLALPGPTGASDGTIVAASIRTGAVDARVVAPSAVMSADIGRDHVSWDDLSPTVRGLAEAEKWNVWLAAQTFPAEECLALRYGAGVWVAWAASRFYVSSDASEWVQYSGGPDNQFFADLTFHPDSGWVALFSSSSYCSLSTSQDGRTWTNYQLAGPEGAPQFCTAVATDGQGQILVTSSLASAPLWRSVDGGATFAVVDLAAFGITALNAAAFGELWTVGGETSSGDGLVLSSDDGIAWTDDSQGDDLPFQGQGISDLATDSQGVRMAIMDGFHLARSIGRGPWTAILGCCHTQASFTGGLWVVGTNTSADGVDWTEYTFSSHIPRLVAGNETGTWVGCESSTLLRRVLISTKP